jgi:hypothetical protein
MKIGISVGLKCGHTTTMRVIDFQNSDGRYGKSVRGNYNVHVLGECPIVGLTEIYCNDHQAMAMVKRVVIFEIERDVPEFS